MVWMVLPLFFVVACAILVQVTGESSVAVAMAVDIRFVGHVSLQYVVGVNFFLLLLKPTSPNK